MEHMDQDASDSINSSDAIGQASGLFPQDISMHPQLSAFAPDPVLPPGLGDLAALERLKDAIKKNQHELYRSIPRPAFLASLWQGPASMGSDSDSLGPQPMEGYSEDSVTGMTGEKTGTLNGSADVPPTPLKLDIVNSRTGSRGVSVVPLTNGPTGKGFEPIRKGSIDVRRPILLPCYQELTRVHLAAERSCFTR